MICKIRKWKMSDAAELAAVISNKKIQDNLRDGLPFPYTEQDGAALSLKCFARIQMKRLPLRLRLRIK